MLLVAAAMVSIQPQQGFDPERLARIPQRMRAYVEAGGIAGAVTYVSRHGRVVLFDAQGYADLEAKLPMRRDTIFQIMSMTKPVTALAVALLAEDGLLNLDDPLERHLPQFRDLKVRNSDGQLVAPRRRLTLRHLLTHTSGLGSNDPAGLDDDAKRKLILAEYTDLLAAEPLLAEPGEAIRYSGPGFALLGRVVEVVSKRTLDVFMRERIFQPLGMRDTHFFLPDANRNRLARMYLPAERGLTPLDEDPFRTGARFANPAGGLYSTASDMAKLIECMASGGKAGFHAGSGASGGRRLLSPAMIEAMTTVQTGSLLMDGSEAQGVGLGFMVVKSGVGQAHLKPVGSFGHIGAFGTEFWCNPKTGLVAVFMVQGWGEAERARKTFNTLVNAAFERPHE